MWRHTELLWSWYFLLAVLCLRETWSLARLKHYLCYKQSSGRIAVVSSLSQMMILYHIQLSPRSGPTGSSITHITITFHCSITLNETPYSQLPWDAEMMTQWILNQTKTNLLKWNFSELFPWKDWDILTFHSNQTQIQMLKVLGFQFFNSLGNPNFWPLWKANFS